MAVKRVEFRRFVVQNHRVPHAMITAEAGVGGRCRRMTRAVFISSVDDDQGDLAIKHGTYVR